MPFADVSEGGTTLRGRLSPRQRLAVWERGRGVCVLCGRRIDGVRERWVVEHIRALELGGDDTPENMGPAHEACALDKTRGDRRQAAQAKRRKTRHLGAERPKRALPCGRKSRWKRKITGEIVPRD